MPKHNIEKYLSDIVLYIDELESFSSTIDYQNINKPINRWSVERALSIIGEALAKADTINENLPISNKKQIIGLRHILVHDYDIVEPERLIIILHKHLKLLKEEVIKILDAK
jgi:uncharacterized protein with HEPN domain